MKKKYKIESYISVKNGTILLNNNSIFQSDESTFEVFIKNAYKKLNTNYPKFFKMDNLSKLAFVAADFLLKNLNLDKNTQNNIALIFSNYASSLDTDRKHQNSIKNSDTYFPSPAVFVYTLPNICLGEISIKHHLQSENSFFIFEAFNATILHTYANSLLSDSKAEKVLCGWVNYDENEYEAFLYLVSKKGKIEHNIEEITTLYNQ